ncbi:MAG: dTDP-glucose 4,6-dehydratase [Kiritimatiellaeota bacterium]|nr:dTDP-glucose 4,6-dehydratase [Kiritimatiellota bacterium]
MKRKNILVTGGAGFIGSNFVRMVLDERDDINVVNLDALTYAGNLANLEGYVDSPRHEFVHGDINDAELIDSIIGNNNVDAVVNFAAESHVDRSIEGPRVFYETNVMGTLNLLERVRSSDGDVRFLQVSTDEVYGSLDDGGLFTETTTIKPNSPYSASKAAADHLVHSFRHTFGMDCVMTRCSNNYGPLQFPEKMVPLCINNIKNGKNIPLYGDGLQVRDWLYVHDHCAAILRVLESEPTGEVYNIGGCDEKTNLELVKTILRLLDADESLITFVKDRPGHDRRYAIDSSKLMNELGWAPTVDFETGMRKTIQWYEENQQWLDAVASGDYLSYYERMYDA